MLSLLEPNEVFNLAPPLTAPTTISRRRLENGVTATDTPGSGESSTLVSNRNAEADSPQSSNDGTAPLVCVNNFDDVLDRAWGLLRVHPSRDVQTATVLKMLGARLPIYNRLAADERLCRLVDHYIELSLSSPTSSQPRKLRELNTRERYAALKAARLPSLRTLTEQMRNKCEDYLTQLRFYADCGHYERYVVESGPAKLEQAARRNKLRKCTRCLNRSRLS